MSTNNSTPPDTNVSENTNASVQLNQMGQGLTQKTNKTVSQRSPKTDFREKSRLTDDSKNSRRKVLSVSQILARAQKEKQRKYEKKKGQKPLRPIIPPKSFILILKKQPEKAVYNRRIIDYKHCGLLQKYIGLGGKILPRRQTLLTAKQQRLIAKTIKTARIMGLLPFVTKERGFFR